MPVSGAGGGRYRLDFSVEFEWALRRGYAGRMEDGGRDSGRDQGVLGQPAEGSECAWVVRSSCENLGGRGLPLCYEAAGDSADAFGVLLGNEGSRRLDGRRTAEAVYRFSLGADGG